MAVLRQQTTFVHELYESGAVVVVVVVVEGGSWGRCWCGWGAPRGCMCVTAHWTPLCTVAALLGVRCRHGGRGGEGRHDGPAGQARAPPGDHRWVCLVGRVGVAGWALLLLRGRWGGGGGWVGGGGRACTGGALPALPAPPAGRGAPPRMGCQPPPARRQALKPAPCRSAPAPPCVPPPPPHPLSPLLCRCRRPPPLLLACLPRPAGPVWKPPRPRTVLRGLPFLQGLPDALFHALYNAGTIRGACACARPAVRGGTAAAAWRGAGGCCVARHPRCRL